MLKFLYKPNHLKIYLFLSLIRLLLSAFVSMVVTEEQYMILCIACGIVSAFEFLLQDLEVYQQLQKIKILLVPFVTSEESKRIAWDVVKIHYLESKDLGKVFEDTMSRIRRQL